MFAVVMAGGGGTRLWPKSREHHPKQMHALVGPKPLVQETTERLQNVVGDDQVYIVANGHHAISIAGIMPSMADNIIVDPYRRDTAACIGLAAVYLSKVDPNAVMGVFPADPFIASAERFGDVIRAASELAESGHVITLGITPTGPETGYGYIEMGDEFQVVDGQQVYMVKRFVEKPSLDNAQEYVATGKYLWNSGIFIWSIPTVLSLFEKHLPDTYAKLMQIGEAIGTENEEEIVDSIYKDMQKISIDYGIMEKLDETLVIPGDFGWNDVGSWATVHELAPKDEHGNVVTGSHIGVDTKDCLILGADGRVVATVGVEDLVIVDTEDAILICRKDRTQDVKKIVDKLKEDSLDKYL